MAIDFEADASGLLHKGAAASFWQKVEVGLDDECWTWRASIGGPGYGHQWVEVAGERRCVDAHRLAFLLALGRIPVGAQILHQCDNRRCCNPAHLRAGSPAENALDALLRGRLKTRATPDAAREIAEAKFTPADIIAASERLRLPVDYVRKVRAGRTLAAITGLPPSPLGRRIDPKQGEMDL